MAWYVVHIGHVPGIYRTGEDCYTQVNHYPSNCYKKYNTKVEALRAYYGHPAYLANHGHPPYYSPMNANHGHLPALEIEEEPPVGDMKIRRIVPWSWKDATIFLSLWSLLFLFGR
jgi:hypothetical protein